MALDILVEELQLDDHKIYYDKNKKEIQEIFEELEQKARDFSMEKSELDNKVRKGTFLISIIWVGFSLDPDFDRHDSLI